jgi:hypothetical protein
MHYLTGLVFMYAETQYTFCYKKFEFIIII